MEREEEETGHVFEVVIELDEDVYYAHCPALRGCRTWGHTKAEAFQYIQDAIEMYLEDLIEDGEPIPGIGSGEKSCRCEARDQRATCGLKSWDQNLADPEVYTTLGGIRMRRRCILCESEIKDVQEYLKRERKLIRKTRYQGIIDVLVDSPSSYDLIFQQHDTELPVPYRQIVLRKISALQEEPGRGTHLRKKFADVTAVKGNECDVVIEEELKPKFSDLDEYIKVVTKCKYLWANGKTYNLVKPCLFILIDENFNNIPYQVRENVGTFKKVIICDKDEFEAMYEEHYLDS